MHVHLPDSGPGSLREVNGCVAPSPLGRGEERLSGPAASREVAPPALDACGAIAEDLYCLSCGYNLRGLSGDPIRCPECGHENDLWTASYPAAMIRLALRNMETAPTLCVACAVGVVILVPVLLSGFLWTVIPLAACAVLWHICRQRMRRAFDERPGWSRTLVDFHLAMLFFTVFIPMMALVVLIFENATRRRAGLMMLAAVVLAVPAFLFGLGIYHRAQRRLLAMQSDAAVRIAREHLHYAMSRPGK